MFVLPIRPLKEAILHHPGEALGFTSAVAQEGKQNLTMLLKPQRSRGISPDLWAGTLAIPFTHSFLLLFLKLPICSDSSCDRVIFPFCFFFSQPPFSVSRSTAVRLVFTSEPFLWWTPPRQTVTHSRFLGLSFTYLMSNHFFLTLSFFCVSIEVYFLCIASPLQRALYSTSLKLWYVWHYILKSLLSTGRTSSSCQCHLHARL